MESISELRKLCQTTRPAIYSDFLSRFYYKVSIYFTWLCLKMGLSANQVTVLSGIISIIGGLMLIADSKIITMFGIMCFHLFCILDMSDGEVARYRNQGGVTGHYLDWYMHYVSSTALIVGLFLASLDLLDSVILTGISLLAVITPILDKSVQNSGWTVICWTRLRDIKNESDGLCAKQSPEITITKPTKQHTFLYRRFRFLLLSPLQDHWLPTILLIIAASDFILYLLELPFFEYKFLLILYIGILGPINIYLNVRKMVLSQALPDGYKRLVCPDKKIKLPDDDFLG